MIKQQAAKTHRVEEMADLLRSLQSSNQHIVTINSNENVFTFAKKGQQLNDTRQEHQQLSINQLNSKNRSSATSKQQHASECSQGQLVLMKQAKQTTAFGEQGATVANGSPSKGLLGVPKNTQLEEVQNILVNSHQSKNYQTMSSGNIINNSKVGKNTGNNATNSSATKKEADTPAGDQKNVVSFQMNA